MGHGHRSYRDAEIRHVRSAAAIRQRCAMAERLRLQAAGHSDARRRPEFVSTAAVPDRYSKLRSVASQWPAAHRTMRLGALSEDVTSMCERFRVAEIRAHRRSAS